MSLALPTRKEEAFRYADLAALARIWPIAEERIVVGTSETQCHTIVMDGANDAARSLAIEIAPHGKCDLALLSVGSAYGRFELRVTLGAHAVFNFGAVQLGSGAQTLEIVTTVVHDAPNAVSRQTIRSIVAKGATASYLGKVEVARGADGTDSGQDAKAMLLDRLSTANAVPQLEIFADDVKCAHGATVGELDPMAQFYLAARGIAPPQARQLLMTAFIADSFSVIDDAAARERITALAITAMEAML